jgi:EAL domain-containing protein (putative c-di-GMP-specific phosphodiesterase class I)
MTMPSRPDRNGVVPTAQLTLVRDAPDAEPGASSGGLSAERSVPASLPACPDAGRRERQRTLRLSEARAIVDEGRFSTEYQAIVQARTGRTIAYEALARFRRRDDAPIPPTYVFAVLHADPALLLRTELTLKIHQIEHAPRAPLFVNLDPDSWTRAGDRNRNPFLALFSSTPRRIVVEVTEAMATADAARAQVMIDALRARHLPIALDDVGAANGLLSFDAITDAEVLKFDRTLIPRMRHPRCRALVQALTRMARETGARTVLEGVETTTEFVLARDLGFDLVQGFLFRDRARSAGR